MNSLSPAGSVKISVSTRWQRSQGTVPGCQSYWVQEKQGRGESGKMWMEWKHRHEVVLTWVAAAMTPTEGSNRHWAVGFWCCLWVRVWDRAVVCPPAGFPPEDASLRPWARRERRCSSGWPQLRPASPPSNPTRSRLARCHLHRRRWTAKLSLWLDEGLFKKKNLHSTETHPLST